MHNLSTPPLRTFAWAMVNRAAGSFVNSPRTRSVAASDTGGCPSDGVNDGLHTDHGIYW